MGWLSYNNPPTKQEQYPDEMYDPDWCGWWTNNEKEKKQRKEAEEAEEAKRNKAKGDPYSISHLAPPVLSKKQFQAMSPVARRDYQKTVAAYIKAAESIQAAKARANEAMKQTWRECWRGLGRVFVEIFIGIGRAIIDVGKAIIDVGKAIIDMFVSLGKAFVNMCVTIGKAFAESFRKKSTNHSKTTQTKADKR